ncbi:MAG: hypothetical protein N3I35_00315 [Clostridia bacterium]|nr:hypothetical protein [Clostridia bacterium]
MPINAGVNLAYSVTFNITKGSVVEAIKKILGYLEEVQKTAGVEFFYRIGKRKSQLQKFMEKLQEYKERQEQYDTHNQLFEVRNNYSKTDTDSITE